LSDEPTLVVLNGLVATGKTRVTDSLVAELGYYAIYSDWYWFRHGVRDRDTNPKVNVDHNTYMMYLCWSALAMGRGARVVLDTTSRWSSFRKDIQNQAAKYGVRVVFVHCHCDDEESKRRIQLRRPGGHDQFGTSHEYDRIKGDYEPLDDDELKQYNVIDVDTQKLECKIVNAAWYELEDEMKSIINAIKTRSFEQVKTF